MNEIYTVTVFDKATGRIVSSGTSQAPELFETETQSVLIGVSAPVQGAYVEGGVVVQMPTKPSPNHTFNYTSKQWEDPRTLADLKAEKWRNIKANRDAAEHGGFTWDGSVFDSDALSQQRITGAVTLAQMSPAFTTVWTLANNSTRTLSAADMFAVGMALGTHVATQFLQGQLLREQIDDAATAQEVEAIHW
jgi:hypothetical protein